jgi:hypothetical protein
MEMHGRTTKYWGNSMILLKRIVHVPIILMLQFTACTTAGSSRTPPPSVKAEDPRTEEPSEILVELLFPVEDVELEMGQSTRFTFQVDTVNREPVDAAQVMLSVLDPDSNAFADLVAQSAGNGIYRTDSWTLPRRVSSGLWRVEVSAESGEGQGTLVGYFSVKEGISEIVLHKYGYWIDQPSLGGIAPHIILERGDAQNGVMLWSGSNLGMHIVPQVRMEIHWRWGDHGLDDAQAVHSFMRLEGLNALNDMRRIDAVESQSFKDWHAWRVECTTHSWEEMEWLIFYAPEVNKTYAIATILTLPPSIPDPHGVLRESFAVYPEINASGVAPSPFEPLLPGPELIGPPLASRFRGLDEPIILQWEEVRELADDEYYEVLFTYYYKEANPTAMFTARDTELVVPESLYRSPNCSVFNWQVTLKRQTAIQSNGQPRGEPLSYPGLYWYFWWFYPPGEDPAFSPGCPYTHLD